MLEKKLEDLSLSLRYSLGLVDGKEKFSHRSYGRLNLQASDENLLEFANTIGSLQEEDPVKIIKIEKSSLSK